MHLGSQKQSPQHLATDFTLSPLHENKAENWHEQRVQTRCHCLWSPLDKWHDTCLRELCQAHWTNHQQPWVVKNGRVFFGFVAWIIFFNSLYKQEFYSSVEENPRQALRSNTSWLDICGRLLAQLWEAAGCWLRTGLAHGAARFIKCVFWISHPAGHTWACSPPPVTRCSDHWRKRCACSRPRAQHPAWLCTHSSTVRARDLCL